MTNIRACHKRVLVAALSLLALASFSVPQAGLSYSTDASETPDARAGLASIGPDRAASERALKGYGKLPLCFELNQGQADPRVRFISRGDGFNLALTADQAILLLASTHTAGSSRRGKSIRKPTSALLKMKLLGANPQPKIEGLGEMPGRSSYFIGADPNKWRTGVPSYERVLYSGIYRGIDLVYYGNGRQLEYDFHVAPGASPDAIRMSFKGARRIRIGKDGGLEIPTSAGTVRMKKPFIYQENDGGRREVLGGYILLGKDRVGFKIASYDTSKALVIDPVLSYSTFLGGINEEAGTSIVVDSTGSAYVTGRTLSFNFPVTIDAFDTTFDNGFDVFVTKLNAAGTDILYSTYLGGQQEEHGLAIDIDQAGNAYITGITRSDNYPTTPGAFQTVLGGFFSRDAFVTKLNSTGTDLIYSTFLGSQGDEQGNGIDVDSSGNAFITGFTGSPAFPTTPGAFQTTLGGGSFSSDAFITKLNSTGTGLIYSTFLGGSNSESGNSIRADSVGDAYVTGSTHSPDFDVTPGAFQTTFGDSSGQFIADAFITKLNSTGTGLLYSTYLGSSGHEEGLGIALSSNGEAHITGSTTSPLFPTTPGVVKVIKEGVARSTNGGFVWGTALAGFQNFNVISLRMDPNDSSVLYAGTQGGGIYKSTNGGQSWAASNSGLTDLFIKAIDVDLANQALVYLGTASRGVFRSTDGGTSWRAINTGLGGANINSLKVDPATPSTIYAATNASLFKTTNGGSTWFASNAGLGFSSVESVEINPATPAVLYAGMSFGGIFKSTDGGTSWNATSLTNGEINDVVVDAANTSLVYAATEGGVYKSTDGGGLWVGINLGIENRSINALAITPDNPLVLYAGTEGGVFKSTDGGNIWGLPNAGLSGAAVTALAIDPDDPTTVFAAATQRSNNSDGFVTKLNSAGSALSYSTLLGGTGFEQGSSIKLDPSGNAYITGITNSDNFPTTLNSFGFAINSFGNDAFVSKLNPIASLLSYSTYLGGTDFDEGACIDIDSFGSVFVTGSTRSNNYPITPGAFQPLMGGSGGFGTDAFITKIESVPSFISDLKVVMSSNAGTISPGDSVTYNITITNLGPDPAVSVRVEDDVPSGLNNVTCFSSTIPCFGSGNSVFFALNTLDVGEEVTLTIIGTGSCSIPPSVTFNNTIRISSSGFDTNPSDNTATITTTATNPVTTLVPTSASFPGTGGSATVQVNRQAPCNWPAFSTVNWITITSISNFGNGFVGYTVAPNPGPAIRSGTIIAAGQTFTVFQGINFNDVPSNHPFYNEIGRLSARGVTLGCDANNYCPDDVVTRQQMAAFIIRALGDFNPPPPAQQRFLDVPPSNPFYAFIEQMAIRQITLGCGGGNYCPTDPVLRDQMAAFIIRGLGEFNPPDPPFQRFLDVPPANPFYRFIDRMAVLQITLGCGGGNYCPSLQVSRGQMAAFLVRAFNL